MLGLFRKKVPYEELGYMYADSLLATTVQELASSTMEWTGRELDTEQVGRDLAILALSFFQMTLMNTVPKEYASSRVLGGFMQRTQERYANFAFDPTTSAIGGDYIRIAAIDLRNKNRIGNFPTLVPSATARITGLSKADQYWPNALAQVDAFIQIVIQTATQAVEVTKANARLV